MEKRTKEVKVTFFITGQDDKSKAIETPELFNAAWKSHFSNSLAKAAFSDTKILGDSKVKELVLCISEYDSDADFYFGHVGVFRDTTLPTIYNKEKFTDTNIPLGSDDEILEKSYFLYYPTQDLLVFHQNHLGPKADDLAYLLFKINNMSRVTFEPIWKNADIKSLLETGSVLKNGTISLALPRNFSEAGLDLSNNWSKEIIGMMSRTGMSKMTINFWGRASKKKGQAGYIVEDVKGGIKELLSKFSMGSQRSGQSQPEIKKAEAQLANGKKESLLNQELNTRVSVEVVCGYPSLGAIRQALINAKITCHKSLLPYMTQKKDIA